MSDSLEIPVVVAPSLLDHVKEGLDRQSAGTDPTDKIIDLLTQILDGSEFPIVAQRTESGAIEVSYRLRSFSQPLF